MFLEMKEINIEKKGRSKWATKTIGVFLCDQCQVKFTTSKNVKRKRELNFTFCSRTCSSLARRYGGVIHSHNAMTCQDEYGVDHFSKRKDVCAKRKSTFLKTYGVDNPSKLKEIQTKKEETCLLNYGVRNPQKSKKIQKKTVETNKRKYGFSYPIQNADIKKKAQNTNVKRYGNKNPAKSKIIQDKITQALTKWTIAETEEPVKVWLANQTGSVPSYSYLIKYLTENNENYVVPESVLEQLLVDYRSSKSSLEVLGEHLFGEPFWNKRIPEIPIVIKPDFMLSNSVYVNVDGLYWHSDARKANKRYHWDLRNQTEQANIKLFQIREDEVKHKGPIVKSIIANALNKTPRRIYARKCKSSSLAVKEVRSFLKENHLMGYSNARHVALEFENVIVAVLTYRVKGTTLNIERFCTKLYHSIVGGFSKLLKQALVNSSSAPITKIHNWVDLRYGTGKHLIKLGFIIERETLGWKWTDNYQTFNRLQCKAGIYDGVYETQKERAKQLKWTKIYDAGQRLYTKNFLPLS